MRILVIGPYKSPDFLKWDGKMDAGLGGLRKLPSAIRALLMAGHEVKVVSSAVSVDSSWRWQRRMRTVAEFPEGKVEAVHVGTTAIKPWGGLWACLAARRESLRVAREWKPEIIYAYNGLLAEALSLTAIHKRYRTPLVVEVEDAAGVRGRGFSPKPFLDRQGWKALDGRIAGFVLVNKALRQILNCGSRPWMLFPGIVDEQLTQFAAKRKRPFSGLQRKLIYAGGLSTARGADRLLAALEFLPDNWQLVVSGAGPLADDFKNAQDRNPSRCRNLGFVPLEEMYREMTSADVAVNTPEQLADQEGVFPFKMFEYIASGAHVISPPLPDVGGPSFKYFQRWNGSPAQLGELLQRAEGDFERETAEREAARDWILANFNLAGISTNMDGLLKTVARDGSKSGRQA